jgi:hypothetical protein
MILHTHRLRQGELYHHQKKKDMEKKIKDKSNCLKECFKGTLLRYEGVAISNFV